MQNPSISPHVPELAVEPKYLIGSVDGALQLLQLLRDEGSLRVMTAADHLGVSRSTAHRLLNMLVYRGFAAQDEDRIYQPGPGMNVPPVRTDSIRSFKIRSEPLFAEFVRELGETVSLITRFGTTTRFIETYVSENTFAVSSRRGQILPAIHSSAGKVLLSLLSDESLAQLYRSRSAALSRNHLSPKQFQAFLQEIQNVREVGYALNLGQTEPGLSAISFPLKSPEQGTWFAFAVAVPAPKGPSLTDETFIAQCRAFKQRIDGLFEMHE